MNMFNLEFGYKQIVTFFVTCLMFVHADARGGINEGGGKGVLCENKLMALELYEAQELGEKVPVSLNSLEEEIKRGNQKYAAELRFISPFIDNPNRSSQSNVPYIPTENFAFFSQITENMNILPTNDVTLRVQLKPGCSLVQIFSLLVDNQESTARLEYNPRYLAMLDSLNLYALTLHEIYGFILRKNKDATQHQINALTTDEIRAIVGLEITRERNYLENKFFNFRLPNIDQNSGKWAKCRSAVKNKNSEVFSFYMKKAELDGVSGMMLYFSKFKNLHTLIPIQTFVPGLSISHSEPFSLMRTQIQTVIAQSPILNKSWILQIGTTNEMPNKSIDLLLKAKALNSTDEVSEFSEVSCDFSSLN